MRTTPLTSLCAVAAAALFSALAAGCGSSSHAAGAGGTVATVTEKDFHISAPATLAAGEVAFVVSNEGPDRHEFIVAQVGASKPPLRADGLTIDEETLQKQEVGELEPAGPGALRTLRLKLAPGRYIFFCNMAGHYLGGMHHEVMVQ